MAASIFYTTYKIYHVGEEVTELSDIFIPLSSQIAGIDIQIVTQQLHVKQIDKFHADSKLFKVELDQLKNKVEGQNPLLNSTLRSKKIAALQTQLEKLASLILIEEEKLESIELKVDESINISKAIIDKFVDITNLPLNRNKLNSLRSLLIVIDQKHSNVHSKLELLADSFDDDNNALRFKLERLIEKEEAELNQHLKDTWAKIANFTQAAANDTQIHQQHALTVGFGLTGFAGLLALILAGLVIRSMMRPLRRLIVGAGQVEAGDLSNELPISTRDEIGDLTRSFNGMIQGLRRSEEIKGKFGQYVDPRVVSGLIDDPSMENVHGEKKTVSVFFADLANFTGISERFTPTGLIKLVNRYLSIMSEPVAEHHGLIDKYIGDAIMAFWTAPFCPEGEQAPLAVAAALQDVALIKVLREELPELTGLRRDLPDIDMRIGIATGDAIVGSIGSERTKNYTVIGDTVNLGARLEGANKVYGTKILVCKRTYEMASGTFEFRKIDHLVVKGKTEPISIYEPLGPTSQVSPELIEFRDRFEEALEAFHQGAWERARKLFGDCREKNNSDSATATYQDRLSINEHHGAPDDWDGVWRLETK